MKHLIVATVCAFFMVACAGAPETGYKKNLQSWNNLKWENVVRQAHDYSCGSASLATLARGYFGDKVSERAIIEQLINNLAADEISDRIENGFTFNDLKKTAMSLGYDVVGVKLQPEAIFELKGPVMVVLKIDEWEHFAILKGVRNGRVYLADPARGNLRVSLDLFLSQWDGFAFALGKPDFGLPSSYPLALKKHSPVIVPEVGSLRSVSPAFGPQK